jgi:hypothetical protein
MNLQGLTIEGNYRNLQEGLTRRKKETLLQESREVHFKKKENLLTSTRIVHMKKGNPFHGIRKGWLKE